VPCSTPHHTPQLDWVQPSALCVLNTSKTSFLRGLTENPATSTTGECSGAALYTTDGDNTALYVTYRPGTGTDTNLQFAYKNKGAPLDDMLMHTPHARAPHGSQARR
jgi:hypothetical protein